MEIETGVIRKITIGDPIKGMTYQVGNKTYNGVISAIVEDERYFIKYGAVRYCIYVMKHNEEFSKLWKDVKNHAITVEYNLKPEENYETY